MNEAVGHRAVLIGALLLVGSFVAPLSLSRVATADDLSVTGTASPTMIDATQNVDFTCDPSGGTTPYSYIWDFGDGVGTSAYQNPSYEYDNTGTWTATITVTDDLGGTAYWSVDITVNELPSATGTPASATIDAGQGVDFACTPSGGSGSGYTFFWDFGDGLGTSSEQNPSYTFPSAGTFYVTVTVTDGLGGSSSPQDIGEITVNPSLSVTGTASATAIDASQTVDFTCTPSDGTSPYTYSWTFGDGGSSTDQNPPYEYDSIGTWTAEVTVTDDVGETAYWSVEIKVYNIHDPILILNDEFTSDNGVVSGSGTIDDPYIIEDWGIDASGAMGIDIEVTDAYFIVRDCYIYNGIGSGYFGIYLYDCVNGILSDNTCLNNLAGIHLESSDGIAVSGNTCTDNYDGIYLYDSSSNTLSNNTCSFSSRYGIALYSSSDNIIWNNILDSTSNIGIYLQQSSNSNTVSNNTCSNANYGIGLSLSSGNSISNNTCSSSYFAGMRLSLSNGNILSNNTCSSNYIGMIIQRSNSNALSNNNCSSNDEYGVYIYASSNSNTLVNNTCTYNLEGMYLYNSNDNTISDNNCSSNDYDGIYLASSSSNEMTRNQLCDNAQYGISIDSGSGSNAIWRNTFIDNNGAGSEYNAANIQAYDDGTDNLWYSPGTPQGYGNYWNDWTTPDADSNSIVDSPYVIDGSSASQDIYPLTIPEELLTKTIKGQVRDEMDTPIPGAQVAVTIKNGEVVIVTKTTTTDLDGNYAVTFDQDEWSIGYTIEVTAQYSEQMTETIEADGSTVQTVDIQFPFEIPQFGSALGFLLTGALVGVIAAIFLSRRRKG